MISRMFECKLSGHNKFWEVTYDEKLMLFPRRVAVFTFRYGPIGKQGISSYKSMNYNELRTIIKSKLKKGYKEVGAPSVSAVKLNKFKHKGLLDFSRIE